MIQPGGWQSGGSGGPIRILYVARFDTGGAVISLHTLVAHLDRSRFEPVVLFYRQNPWCERFREIDADVRVLKKDDPQKPLPDTVSRAVSPLKRIRATRVVGKFLRRDVPMARRIAAEVRDAAPNLVSHNDNLRAHRASVLGGWLAGVQQICHTRSLTNYLPLLDVPLARTIDAFICISSAVASQCRRELLLGAERCSVISVPVDVEHFSRATSKRDRIRAELGFGGEEPVVANVGRVVPGKGQDVFLRSFAWVAERHPLARALIVGAVGPEGRGEQFQRELHRLVRELDLQKRVTFLGHREDVAEIMAAADIVVQSSSSPEGLGRVLMEGMAAGRPVVGTDAGGPTDVVTEGETGHLVPMGDWQAMGLALDRLLSDQDAAREMGSRGRQHAQERFGVQAHVDRMTTVYEDLLDGGGHRTADRWNSPVHRVGSVI